MVTRTWYQFLILESNYYMTIYYGSGNGCEKLELSFVYFFQQFRKSYIGESSQRISKVYSKLSENLGINDQNMLLEIIVRKIATNLQTWGDSSSIVKQSVTLLNDLAGGYSSVRLLRKIETLRIISNDVFKAISRALSPYNSKTPKLT
ncbi:9164_t:CDS:2 [Entrophospora sp. SA101]|nr:9164_t:CDS:2 [Entrophospora sp. SA101]